MRASLIIALLLALLATSAHGRVGETVKQVEARYGKPQHVYDDRSSSQKLGYRFRGMMVIVLFKDGISKCETFMGWPEGDKLPPLPRERVQQILALSAPKGQSWHSIPRTRNGEYWASSDKKTLAFFGAKGTSVLVGDPNFIEND
jgi:hypothetical protein